MSTNYDLIRKAAVEGKQAVFMYQGYRRETCPHVVGHKNGLERVLVFQFAGGSSSGLPIDGQWRCLSPGEISGIELRDGPWKYGKSHSRPQTCVDNIDVEVHVAFDGTPTPYFKRAYS